MSNPAPWGKNAPSGQQGGGQVTFFDPTKFQKAPQDFPNFTANPQGHNQASSIAPTQGVTQQVTAANAWTSWSWGDASNPYLKEQNSGEYTNNSTGYNNQIQWNGQQWNQGQEQTDQNQYHWDQNTQQWQPNYYDHFQQGIDQNQYGYNQQWNAAVSHSSNTATENYSLTDAASDQNSGYQNSASQSVKNSEFAQQGPLGDTSLSSSNDTYQPDNYVNHSTENLPQNEHLNQSNSSYGETQSDYVSHLTTSEGDDSLDHSEGSVGRFFVNDYVGESEPHLSLRQSSDQGVSTSDQKVCQNYSGSSAEKNNVITDSSNDANSIHSQILDNKQSIHNQAQLTSQSSTSNDDKVSQNHVNQEYTGHSDHVYQYYTGDESQNHPSQVAKEFEKEEDASQPAKSETHSEDGWELVQPHGLEPPTHSRNHSVDNNVQFFISSGNSSLRVSPSGSSKSKDEVESIPGQNEGQTDGAKKDGDNLKDRLEKSDQSQMQSVHTCSENRETPGEIPPQSTAVGLSCPPPSSSLGPPPMGGVGSVNPFRRSPATVSKPYNPSPLTHDSLLSSTRLDTTKANFENSPVVLNQSISPIPPSSEIQNRNVNGESPDIQTPAQLELNPDTPLSTINQRKGITVPQSPIMARKESPFQPPVPASKNISDSRNKPIKACHTIPGVSSNIPKSSNPDVEQDRAGRKTPDWESSQREKSYGRRTPDWDRNNESKPGRRTPDLDNGRRYERRTGRRTPDWDSRQNADRYGRRTPDWERQRTSERDQGRRTPDWDSKPRRYGRKTPEWDQSAYGRELDEDRLSTKPPAGSSTVSGKSGPQRAQARQSAFRDMVKNRSKNNVSPATSLLDFEPPAMSNILLVPAVAGAKTVKSDQSKDTSEELSALKPVASLISSLSEQISTDESLSKVKGQVKTRSDDKAEKLRSDNLREPNMLSGYDKSSDRNSKDSLKLNRSYEKGLNDSRNVSREKLRSYGSRDSLDIELRDDSRERHRRGNSRDRDRLDTYDRYYRDRDRDRPPSRNTEEYKRNGYRDREYGRPSERYDRPRSRHDENRPPSRQGDMDRSRSRADYDKDAYYRDKQRGNDYDDYYRRSGQYYDRSYYDYYYYNQGYYDEMGYYHDPNASRYAYDQRRPRAGTPGSMSDAGDEFEYPPDFQQYSGYYDDHYGYYGDYNGQRWDPHVQQWVQQTAVEQEPRRATPEKFTIPHMRASFGPNGQLVKILPNRPSDGQPATIEIHEVEAMLADNTASQELREFPGPLIRGDTHKNDVLLFCQRKAKECTDNMELADRESSELIWRFLELLIKQNGTIVGTDLADLLLEGHEPTTLDYRQTGMKIAQSLEMLDAVEDGEEEQSVVTADRSSVNRAKTVEEITDRFRHLLLYGRKKDALDWAMKNNLWGHALFLASKMDSRAHANVMTRFANVAMRMNDPLQTLYQQMSGRQPAAVTCVAEERWGDWRPHLAMILSNHTSRPDLDRKSITQLGDTLAAKGFLHASHFCYLMSQTSFGSYNKKTSKIVLIGSSHTNLPLELFGNNEAIQCTEVYEYALALGNTAVYLHNFQSFKFLYATRLSDWGFPQEALQYCEIVAKTINMNPSLYQHTLVKLVYDLASQLKFSDPQKLEETDDTLDPDWLRCLHTTLVQFEEGAIQTMSGTATPMYFSGTRASSESGEVGMYMQGGDFGSQGSFQQENGCGNQGQMYSIKEQSAYQQAYMHGQGDFQQPGFPQQEVTADSSQYQNQGTIDGSQSQQIDGNQWQQYAGDEGQQQTDNESHANWQQGYSNYDQHQWASQHQQQAVSQGVVTDGASEATDQTDSASQSHTFQQQDPHATGSWNTTQSKPSGFPPVTNLGNSIGSTGSAKRESLASTSSFSRGDSQGADDVDDDEDLDGMGSGPQPGIFDLQPSGPQKIIAPRLRKRTISGDSAGSGPSMATQQQQQKKEENKIAEDKSKSQGKGGEGIWGKIGGLFTRKGKNEMILPDDKEPSIVWDEAKKQWVNKDGSDEGNTVAAPPPKDHEIPGRAGPKPGHLPEKRGSLPVAPSAPSADGAGNVFQRRRGPLGARGQYVDVMNPKPAASTNQVPSTLFNTLPHAQSAPAIFVPGGSADDSKKHSPAPEPIQEEKLSAPPTSAPQMNALSVLQDDSLSRSSSMSSVSQEVQQILAKKEASAPAGPGSAPVLFNPTQFQGNQSAKQPQGGAGHRLSSRRVYPK